MADDGLLLRPCEPAPVDETLLLVAQAPDRLRTPAVMGEAAPTRRLRAVPLLVTMIAVLLAGVLFWAMWQAYMAAPWTRDGTVRAYVVTIAPEVSGRVVRLPATDNQFVRKGNRLLEIDPTDYAIALDQAQAAADQAGATADNAEREADRRASLTTLEASHEEMQSYRSVAIAARAAYRLAIANLARARVNLERATIRSPVNGYVTNLLVQTGDYATAGQSVLSLVNADSFWVDAYFEETKLDRIHPGDRANIKLMGYPTWLAAHVAGIARGITVANATLGQSGLAQVNPIFTWVRLAQRVPVRIDLDRVPDDLHLVAGETASVEIAPAGGSRQTLRPGSPEKTTAPDK